MWRLYFCDQYYQLSDVLLANWSWVIENGISIFPIAGSFHHSTNVQDEIIKLITPDNIDGGKELFTKTDSKFY